MGSLNLSPFDVVILTALAVVPGSIAAQAFRNASRLPASDGQQRAAVAMWAALASPTIVYSWPLVVAALERDAGFHAPSALATLLALLFVAPFAIGWAAGRVVRSPSNRETLANAGFYPDGATSLWFDYMNSNRSPNWTRFRYGDEEYMGAVVRVGATFGEMQLRSICRCEDRSDAGLEGWIVILDGKGGVTWIFEEPPPSRATARHQAPSLA